MNLNKQLMKGGTGNQQANGNIINNFYGNNFIIFYESDIKETIKHFSSSIDCIENNALSEFHKIPLNIKNQLNNLSDEYFELIEEDFQYFDKIDSFLKNPINEKYLEMYMATVKDLKKKIIAHRSKYDCFEEVIDAIYNHIMKDYENNIGFQRDMVYIFLHHMYCNCHIGKKGES